MTASANTPLVLGVDAATPPASVALVQGCDLLASTSGPFGPQTDAWILAGVDSVLADAGVSLTQVDRIASSIGPGTFTGIRVGIATASGLARGAGARCVGITTLEALIESATKENGRDPGAVLAVVDARRGQLYAALSIADSTPTAGMAFQWGPDLLTPPELIERIGDSEPTMVSPGASVCEQFETVTQRINTPPLAAAVARLAARAGENQLPAMLPFYLRPVDAVPGPSPLRNNANKSDGFVPDTWHNSTD